MINISNVSLAASLGPPVLWQSPTKSSEHLREPYRIHWWSVENNDVSNAKWLLPPFQISIQYSQKCFNLPEIFTSVTRSLTELKHKFCLYICKWIKLKQTCKPLKLIKIMAFIMFIWSSNHAECYLSSKLVSSLSR